MDEGSHCSIVRCYHPTRFQLRRDRRAVHLDWVKKHDLPDDSSRNTPLAVFYSWAVDWQRSETVLQQMVDEASQVAYQFSDLFAPCRRLLYPQDFHANA